MFASLRNANLMLAFLLEIAMLAGLAYFGWHHDGPLWQRAGLAVGLVAVVIVLWGFWAAPRARRRLKAGRLFVFKLAIFAVATAAWWAAGVELVGAIFGAMAVIHLLVAAVFRQV